VIYVCYLIRFLYVCRLDAAALYRGVYCAAYTGNVVLIVVSYSTRSLTVHLSILLTLFPQCERENKTSSIEVSTVPHSHVSFSNTNIIQDKQCHFVRRLILNVRFVSVQFLVLINQAT
jgi:hypothetical protein